MITNSTISGNSAGAGGSGGLGFPGGNPGVAGTGGGLDDVGGAALTNVTVAGNTAHGNADGIDDEGTSSQPSESGSVIAGNGVQNCSGPPIKDGGSNVTFPAQPFSDCPGTTADPRLGPLQNNGGPTATIALLPGSAALGLVPVAVCVSADQRGVARPQGSACDAGAFEWAPPVIGATSATATGQTTAVVKATITNPDLQGAQVAVNYGTTTSYGSTTAQQDLGTSAAALSATVPLSGLRPGTVYHVQALVTNADGTSRSSDMTAVTAPSTLHPPAPTVTGFHQSATRDDVHVQAQRNRDLRSGVHPYRHRTQGQGALRSANPRQSAQPLLPAWRAGRVTATWRPRRDQQGRVPGPPHARHSAATGPLHGHDRRHQLAGTADQAAATVVHDRSEVRGPLRTLWRLSSERLNSNAIVRARTSRPP